MAIAKPEFENISEHKPMINIGALLDIPSGYYIKGIYGENILIGGLSNVTGIVGGGNTYKSTIMHYMMLSAMNKIMASTDTIAMTYDTEINIYRERLGHLANQFEYLNSKDLFNDGVWFVTDKSMHYGNEWFAKLKNYLANKKENEKDHIVELPYMQKLNGKNVQAKVLLPSFTEIDSLTEFMTSDVAKISDDNELGDSGGNTIFMRQGLAKSRMLMEIPALSAKYNNYFLVTGHMGKDNTMQQGPYMQMPTKKLPHMKVGDKIKGVTDKFFFLISSCWHILNATSLINKDSKESLYPAEYTTAENDLSIVTMKQLRSKSGLSGLSVELIVSQLDGLLEHLTLFHFIKENDRFGLDGNKQNYSLYILPEIKLSRTTIRDKITFNPNLRRALEITADMLQIYMFHPKYRSLFLPMQEIYKRIQDLGYSWNMILNHTRGWWTVNENYIKLDKYFLSTLDILLMAHNQYHPYWLEDDKITIKDKYRKT